MNLTKQFFKYVSQNIFGLIGTSCYILADTYFIAQAAGTDGVGKKPLRPRLALRLQDGVPGGSTQADHRAEGKDQVVHGRSGFFPTPSSVPA